MKMLFLLSFLCVSSSLQAAVNDPFFPQQWSLKNDGSEIFYIDINKNKSLKQVGKAGVDIGWEDAQAKVSASVLAPVTVAVIDYGIDPSHPDLKDRISADGYDFILKTANMSDSDGHGTHVSGIIAANSNNGIGISGITPSSVKILPLRILSDQFKNFAYQGKLISDYAADAIRYATAHHASIINLSLGWPKLVDTQNARDAVAEAVKAGVLVVAAAGNDRKDEPVYPCSYEGVLCVGSISNNGTMAVYSDTGGQVDVLAPGDGILSLFPTALDSQLLRIQGYEKLTGTSQAAPHVSGIAAVIKSMNPAISLNELRARVLASTAALPEQNSSLYGMVHLARALNQIPKPVFLPNFKSLDHVSIDEATMTVSGSASLTNLWAAAEGVQAKVLLNQQVVGSLSLHSVASGQTITIPWKNTLPSLNQDSIITLTVQVSTRMGELKSFNVRVPLVRAVADVEKNKTLTVAGVNVSDWIGVQNGQLYSNLVQVNTYPQQNGLPVYYRQTNNKDPRAVLVDATLQLFDSNTVQTLTIPGVQQVIQVIRMDADQDGKMDWLVIGPGKNKTQNYLEFYFMNAAFQPLWKTTAASTWQLYSSFGQNVYRNYATPGSWITVDGQLRPCFLGQGILPDADNYSEQDRRRYDPADTHFYYYAPMLGKPPADASADVVHLEFRAFDNATFRLANPGVALKSIISPSAADQAQGKVKVMTSVGGRLPQGLNSQNEIWSVGSRLQVASGWGSVLSSGNPLKVLSPAFGSGVSPSYTAFVSFFDETRGNITWTNSEGAWVDETNYDYSSLENPILNVIGTFEMDGKTPAQDRYWFVESNFDLLSFHQDAVTKVVQQKSVPIERESTFTGPQFSQIFTPVLVGTENTSVPGVYIDSTLVRGNQVAVLVWDEATHGPLKPLRYSLQVPANCVQMNPVHLTDESSSFTIPFFCANAQKQIEFHLVTP